MIGFFERLTSAKRGLLLVVAGVVLVSFDALLVRLAGVSGWDVGFWRGLFTALSLGSALRFQGKSFLAEPPFLIPLLLVGVINALSSLSLTLAFTLTTAANAVVFLSAAPLFAALSARLLIGEACPPRTWVAILLCSLGVVWVVSGNIGGGAITGDLLALGATLLVGVYFTLYRKYPGLSRMQGVALGGVCLMLVSWPMATPFSLPTATYGWLALAGLFQMPVAMLMITSGTRHLPAAEVSLFLLLETLLAPIWVWWVFGEVPATSTWLGGGLIVLTLVGHTLWGMRLLKGHSSEV